ncbi:hypothetical protein IWX90DRAFT_482159 [Phyllosticta citrichinensis]|uniref:Uncharacterized protein n=1 Tax=Phyllosticta citrichinensis TaxID=1130410 RepID=A0ABR1Y5X0_9PEZI
MAITIHTAYTAPVNLSSNHNTNPPSSTPSSNGTPLSSSPPSPSFPRLSHAHLWAGLQRKVDFQQPDGSTITNLISTGAGGQDDLYLTYIFEWRHPELSADASDEIAKLQAKHDAMAKMAVEKSIESIRKMVAEGVIQEKEGEGWRDIVS